MATILTPQQDNHVDCTFEVRGTCSGANVGVKAKDSNGNPIQGATKQIACIGGQFTVSITVCGVKQGDEVTVEATDDTSTDIITVVMKGDCPDC